MDLPGPIIRQLYIVGVKEDLDAVAEKVKPSMAVTTATVFTNATEFEKLRSQMQQLTEQVAALTTGEWNYTTLLLL